MESRLRTRLAGTLGLLLLGGCLSPVREEADLPQAARDYLGYIADFVGVPVALIGVGPGREQVIWTDVGRASSAGGAAAMA